MLCLFGCYIIFTCFSKEIRKHSEAIIFAHYIMFECYIRSHYCPVKVGKSVFEIVET